MYPGFTPGQQRVTEERNRQRSQDLSARSRQAELQREARAARRERATPDPLRMPPEGSEIAGLGLLGALRVVVLVVLALVIVALVVVLVRGV